MKLIFILIIISISSAFSIEEGQKLNACFVTINSSEEKQEFTNVLSSGPNKGKFNIVELADESSDDDWFQKACEKNIRCDLLLISGHFGGTFFGKSGKSLSSKELEKKSCQNNCEGILSTPKEVFLMGCNTLAGKGEDNRSAGEYLQVLIEDGIPLQRAQQIVEQRYGAIGSSFASTMRRSFKNVPHIYGFHSVGPSGKNVKNLLKDYLKRTEDYYQHLMQIEMQRAFALKGKIDQWDRKNTQIAKSLKSTHFAQTSGLLIGICKGSELLNPDDPNYELMQNMCKLIGQELSEDERANHIIDLLKRDDYELYLGHISDFVRGNEILKNKVKSRLEKDRKIKDKLVSTLPQMKTGMSKVTLAKMLNTLGITSEDKLKKIERSVILEYLKMPVSVDSKDIICSYVSWNQSFFHEFRLKDLDASIFKNRNGLEALSCFRGLDKSITKRVLQVLKTEKNPHIISSVYEILSRSETDDKKVIAFLHRKAKSRKFQEKVLALYTLYSLGQLTDKEREVAEKLMYSEKSIIASRGRIKLHELFSDLIEDSVVEGEIGP